VDFIRAGNELLVVKLDRLADQPETRSTSCTNWTRRAPDCAFLNLSSVPRPIPGAFW
jgi:hypothetical protein